MTEPKSPGRRSNCPACGGRGLVVTNTKRPCAGLKVRYVSCPACGYRAKTAERTVKVIRPGAPKE